MSPTENNTSHNNSAPLKKVAIMRLSALGDVSNALSAVTAIKKHFPEVQLTWFIGKLEHQLLKDISGIEFEIINKKNPFKERQRIKNKYKNQSFDTVLHMQRSLRCSLIVTALKSKRIIGFDAPRAKELQWLFSNEKIEKPKSPHAVDVFMEFAYKFGLSRQQRPVWDFGTFYNSSELETKLKLKTLNSSYIALVVSGSQEDRAWHCKKYASLIDWIQNNTKHQVFLLGGPSAFEKKQAQSILNNIQVEKHNIYNLVGKTDLKTLKSLIKGATLLISPDTGPIHISSALNTKCIGLYVHMPTEITGPYNHLDLCIDKYKEALKRYYNKEAPEPYIGIPKRIKGQPKALNLIEVDEVIEKLKLALYKDRK